MSEPVGRVVFAEREASIRPLRLPFGEAAPQIVLDAGRGLVAILGRLREQLHDDGRDRGRDISQPLGRRHRLPGDVAVHPLHRIGAANGSAPVSIS